MGEGDVAKPVDARKKRRRFKNWMAVAAVAVTLLGALVAYEQSEAIKTSDAAGVQAQRLGVEAVEARAAASDAAELQYSRFLLLELERRRLGNAWQAHTLGDRASRLTIQRLRTVASRTIGATNAIAAAQTSALEHPPAALDSVLGRPLCPVTAPDAGLTPTCASAALGPDQDLAFPRKYFADASWNAERLTALRDAALARGSEREGQIVAYTITLSTFAVAIFLFGFTLTPQAGERGELFAVAAAVLVTIALIYAGYQALHAPAHGRDSAAAGRYADGVVDFAKGDYAGGSSALAAALRLRPDFARAYYQHARAVEAREAPPSSHDDPLVLVPVATLRQEIGDLRAAGRNGLSLADATNRLAADLAQLGIKTSAPGALAESAALATQAARANPADPAPELIRGLALLALGHPQLASGAYRRALSDASRPEPSAEPAEHLAAGALTGLDLVQQHASGRLARWVLDLKQLVVGLGAQVGHPSHETRAEIHGVSLRLNPGFAIWTLGTGSRLDPKRDQLSAQWYYEERRAGGWSVLPAISGPVSPTETASGRFSQSSPCLGSSTKASASACLQPGRYRLELYLDGRLVQQGEARLGGPPMTPAFDREMNVAVCLPYGWVRMGSATGVPSFALEDFPALFNAWTSTDRTQGVLLIRLNGQFNLSGRGGNESSALTAEVAVKAINLWRRAFPAPPTPSPYWSQGSLKVGFTNESGIKRAFHYELPRDQSGGSGVVELQAVFNKNDLAIVTAVYGPRATTRLDNTILYSIGNALS